eukprot:TRINITY_DN16844_c0_g2_i6.p2 TRINITY_DN16844_c0_g2~~TRINITY_DN16844_c0_g2_i6.p2  ORF type:complete len:105 (+),score=27.30 TRINITY_DN16844_c0_g2_i6:29-316(+)
MTSFPLTRNPGKRIVRTRNAQRRLHESKEEFDKSYWTFEEYMCHNLSNYLNDLNQLRTGLSEISHSLAIDLPALKRKSIRPVSYTHLTLPTNREV